MTLDEQVSTIGGRVTVTEKLQLVAFPQVSVAVQLTMVVPKGKMVPLPGVQYSDGGGLQPPLAELE